MLTPMGVGWTNLQASRVAAALEAHPPTSARCERCAIEVRGIGIEADPTAHCLSVRPAGREPFVIPKADLGGRFWHYHFTANVRMHCVDVLTSVPGTETARYLATHWKYPEGLVLCEEEPADD